jgi:hypothetical protein
MISKRLGLVVTFALPAVLAAQTPEIPNQNASDRGEAMVALHSQGARHRATHRRGEVVPPVEHVRNPSAATQAIRAMPAVPGHSDLLTVRAQRATPAVPAHKGGQSGNHRP